MGAVWRRDVISGEMVLFAPDRLRRPNAKSEQIDWRILEDDPFAEGQEHQTPHEVFAIRHGDTAPDTPGWAVRVVPNKFPVFSGTEINAGVEQQSGDELPATGVHEVIIECPQRESHLTRLPAEQVRDVLLAYRSRMSQLSREGAIRHVFIFKNHGRFAGASLLHAHSQLMGQAEPPPIVRVGLNFANQSSPEPFTRLIQFEVEDRSRIVQRSSRYVVLCPFASRFPYEMWILPQWQSSHFERVTDAELSELAETLRDTLRRLEVITGDAAWNFVLHSAPFHEEHPEYRWQIRIFPRITGLAGLELGGGTFVNLVLPEVAAEELRNAESTR